MAGDKEPGSKKPSSKGPSLNIPKMPNDRPTPQDDDFEDLPPASRIPSATSVTSIPRFQAPPQKVSSTYAPTASRVPGGKHLRVIPESIAPSQAPASKAPNFTQLALDNGPNITRLAIDGPLERGITKLALDKAKTVLPTRLTTDEPPERGITKLALDKAKAILPTRLATDRAPSKAPVFDFDDDIAPPPPSSFVPYSKVPVSTASKTALKLDGFVPRSYAPTNEFPVIIDDMNDMRMASMAPARATMTPREAKKHDEWAVDMVAKLHANACPQNYNWKRVEETDEFPGGYQCGGGSHCMTDETIAEGKGALFAARVFREYGRWAGPYYPHSPGHFQQGGNFTDPYGLKELEIEIEKRRARGEVVTDAQTLELWAEQKRNRKGAYAKGSRAN